MKIFFRILSLIGKAYIYYLDHMPRRVTLDTNLRMFQYELLNNVLYRNNMLFRFRKVDYPLSSYCNEEEETPFHLFHSCLKTKQLWNKLKQYLSQFINNLPFTPQSFIVGIFDNNQHAMLINHLLLIFKFYIYMPETQNNCTLII